MQSQHSSSTTHGTLKTSGLESMHNTSLSISCSNYKVSVQIPSYSRGGAPLQCMLAGVNGCDLARGSRTHQDLRSIAPIVCHNVYPRCFVSPTSRALNQLINQRTQLTLPALEKLSQTTPYNMANRGNYK
jgi:hypothetical protein